MIGIAYTSAFLISLVLLGVLVFFYSKRISVYYPLAFFGVVIANLGYMQLASATDLKAALYANQTCYFGCCFTPFLFLMCVTDLCKMQIKKEIQILIAILATSIFALVSTIGVFDVYYKDVQFVVENGYGVLVKEYGPLHNLFPVYLSTIFLLAVYYAARAFGAKKDVPYSTSVLLIISMTFSLVAYALKGLFSLKFDTVPFMYILTQVSILILLRRISLLDVANVTSNSMVESDQYGFVLFDAKGKLLGSDVAAKTWFPIISLTNIGKPLSFENAMLDKLVKDILDGEAKKEASYLELEKYILNVEWEAIKKDISGQVFCIYLRDDTTQQKLNKLYKDYNETLAKEVEAKTEKIRNIQDDIIISMASIVENRDNNTGGHIARTSDIVKIFIRHLKKKSFVIGLSPKVMLDITKAAPLHDFGKIAIPDDILNKKGRFEPHEYEKMKEHSAKGADIVARILQNSNDEEFRKIAVNVAHYHHERWDGTGYPKKLKGTEIPFEARVMALADVFDALVSKRVYKERMSYEEAFKIIEESCGTHFEPELCKAFLECKEELIALYDSYEDD